MRTLRHHIDNEIGGLTIEAALILPLIITAFLFVATMMHMSYLHTKVQTELNDVCMEFMYDSYVLETLGVFDAIQQFSGETRTTKLSTDEVQQLLGGNYSLLSNDLKVELTSAEGFFETSTSLLSCVEEISESIRNVHDTATMEGGYLVSTSLGRLYFQSRLNKIADRHGLSSGIIIEHLDAFQTQDEGSIIISYDYPLTLRLFGEDSYRLKNSCGLQAFTGNAELSIVYHEGIETSQYGKEAASDADGKEEKVYADKVYVTEHGERYHLNLMCWHINVNVSQIGKNDIGSLRSCSKCSNVPIESGDGSYYKTENGRVYHTHRFCSAIYHKISVLTEKEATANGRTPCGSCSSGR